MKAGELKDWFRTQVDDTAQPYLWSDEEIYVYMAEAQTRFCRYAHGIADVSSDLTLVSVITGEEFSEVSELILQIHEARLQSNKRKLHVFNIGEESTSIDDYGLYSMQQDYGLPGPVRAVVIGEELGKVRWVRVPEADDEVRLKVHRLPVVAPSKASDVLEIPSEHHITLFEGMKELAYLKNDAETFDKGKSDVAGRTFVMQCERAKREWERRKHKPRSVAYGGL